MLATLLIVFREVIEAGLVIGIVLAATRGIPKRGQWVCYGIIGGLLGACIIAAFAGKISAAVEGMGQEIFNAIVLGTAVVMLTWHNVWMARHGREIAQQMRALGAAVVEGSKTATALAIVVGLAVLREGSEVVLFLFGIAIAGNDSTTSMLAGGFLGLGLGICLSTITYLGLARIPNRHLFKVTNTMLALLAAGMAAQAFAFLEQAQIITILGETAWNSSHILPESSLLGKTLHTLVGYSDRPTILQVVVYVSMLLIAYGLTHLCARSMKPTQVATAS